MLENRADVNITDRGGYTALHRACARGITENVQLLLENGVDVNITDRKGLTALHRACAIWVKENVQLLLESGADANVVCWDSGAPLQVALRYGHTALVLLLLEQELDVNLRESRFASPLQIASFRGHAKLVRLLLEKGADVRARDKCHQTALDFAHKGALNDKPGVITYDLPPPPFKSYVSLIAYSPKTADSGLLPWVSGEYAKPPFEPALLPFMEEDYKETIRLLLANGAKNGALVDIRDKHLDTYRRVWGSTTSNAASLTGRPNG